MTRASLPLNGVSVLVADDEFFVAELLKDMLEWLGANVRGPVTSVNDIIHEVVENPPDAVTLDVKLGGEYVYRAVPTIQEHEIPFIFVTAYQHLPDCPEELREAPHLMKPFRANELADILMRTLDAGNGIQSN